MAMDGMDTTRPQNPVKIKTRREVDLHNLQYTGILFDDEGRQYRYRTNKNLTPGVSHLINTKLEIEVIVRITDAWSDTGDR